MSEDLVKKYDLDWIDKLYNGDNVFVPAEDGNQYVVDGEKYRSFNADPPDACKSCPNHPSNGGNGVCHCILGCPEWRYL